MPPHDSVKLTLDRERNLAITWRGLEALETQHGISFEEIGEMLQETGQRMRAIRFVLWLALLHEIPDLTVDGTLELMEQADPFEIIRAVNKLMEHMVEPEGNGSSPRRGGQKKKAPAKKRRG